MNKIFYGLFAGLLVYEVVAFVNKKKGDTISENIWKWSINRPLIPFALGVVCGHFFWQETPLEELVKPK